MKPFLASKNVISVKKNGEIYLMIHIAFLAAAEFDDDLFYNVYNHFLVSKLAVIRNQAIYQALTVVLKKIGIKLN